MDYTTNAEVLSLLFFIEQSVLIVFVNFMTPGTNNIAFMILCSLSYNEDFFILYGQFIEQTMNLCS